MNRFILSLLLLIVFALPMSAERKAELFARILPDREQVYAGDSVLLSVVLYASDPIAKAESTTTFGVKGKASVRKLNINRNATAGRTRENGRFYYTLVWNQYVVAPTQPGTYTIGVQKFKATLQQVIAMPDLFDQMMGAQPQYREVKVQGSSPTFTFEVKQKPLRSTQEMMRSSKQGVL